MLAECCACLPLHTSAVVETTAVGGLKFPSDGGRVQCLRRMRMSVMDYGEEE